MSTTQNKGLTPDAKYIKSLFGSIAQTYDKANDAMTFGMAHKWRRKLVKWSEVQPADKVLDCATGTGDLAIEFKRTIGPRGHVIGSDFCAEMLELAPAKANQLGLDVHFEVADVTALPYEDNSFNCVSIAYGIRNVNDPLRALSEMARVLVPGGRLMILETGNAKSAVLNSAVQLYFKHVVPRVGGWISGNKSAYDYLNNSSQQFPCRNDFLKLMEETGAFEKLEYKTLMGGASYIYKGVKRSDLANNS